MNIDKNKQFFLKIQVDFVFSEKLEDIEQGIIRTGRGVDTANLAIAVAIDRIERERLYLQGGFSSASEYFSQSLGKLNLPKQTLSSYRKIGRVYFQYRSQLQKINFNPSGNLNKLRFMEEALKLHSLDEVLEQIQKMTLRQFIEWSKGTLTSQPSSAPFKVTKGGIQDSSGSPLIDFTELTDILNQGNRPKIIGVRDEKEEEVIQEALRVYRENKE